LEPNARLVWVAAERKHEIIAEFITIHGKAATVEASLKTGRDAGDNRPTARSSAPGQDEHPLLGRPRRA
jgi:hypothetical protein